MRARTVIIKALDDAPVEGVVRKIGLLENRPARSFEDNLCEPVATVPCELPLLAVADASLGQRVAVVRAFALESYVVTCARRARIL